MQEEVTFKSGDLNIKGTVTIPDDYKAGEKRPAFLILHGFGSNRTAGNVVLQSKFLSDLGYVTLGFDMRGCGESDGKRANLICLEQVEDTRAAMTYMQSRPEVDADRLGLLGSSFGAAVAVYTGGVDARARAVISSGGWGDGERKFRGQHPGEENWKKFTDMLARGKKHREETGESLMVDRYDIVPIPQHLRHNLAQKSIEQFTAETAQSMYDFRADDVVGNIAPNALLLLHSSIDSVTPTEQSVEMFKRAGKPTDLHLFAETDHFMFAEDNTRVRTVVKDWLDMYFPAKAKTPA
jgi:dipeptidyl aminopeptidase/acylaminoacyl peptidase